MQAAVQPVCITSHISGNCTFVGVQHTPLQRQAAESRVGRQQYPVVGQWAVPFHNISV